MKLSELAADVGAAIPLTVHRDGAFDTPAYVTHPINTRRLLVFVGGERFLPLALANPLVSCILTSSELASRIPEHMGVMTTADPVRAFYDIHGHLRDRTTLYWTPFDTEVHPGAHVAPGVVLPERNVRIGAGAVIERGAVICERSIIGRDVLIGSLCHIGADGFELKRFGDTLAHVRHGGWTDIQDGVRMLGSSTVDLGLFGEATTVGAGTAIDKHAHVSHGVKMGRQCLIASGVVIAAGVLMGDRVRLDPNVAVSHELKLGDDSYVSMGAVVVQNIPAKGRVSGNFAIEHMKFLKNWAKSQL